MGVISSRETGSKKADMLAPDPKEMRSPADCAAQLKREKGKPKAKPRNSSLPAIAAKPSADRGGWACARIRGITNMPSESERPVRTRDGMAPSENMGMARCR